MEIAAYYYIANAHQKKQGFKGFLRICQMDRASGECNYFHERGVSGKTEAKSICKTYGATLWNF